MEKDYNQYDDMAHLLHKYMANKCTGEELSLLLHWLKTTDNPEAFESVSDSLWEKLENRSVSPDKRQLKELNQEVDLILQRLNPKKRQTTGRSVFSSEKWIFGMTAAALLLLAMTLSYYVAGNQKPAPVSWEEIIAERGEVREYSLVDGTRLMLNSESLVRIPSDFNVTDRQVEMSGEVFFDVAADSLKPFKIRNGTAHIDVLGTSFNVRSYADDDYINVTVSTGKVSVSVDDLDLHLRVTPTEHLSINKRTGNLTKQLLAENKYNHWIEGALHFEKEPIAEVIKTINRKYDSRVVLRCKDCEHVLSGIHDNKSLEAVLEAICFTTGLKIKHEGDTIILYK